MSQSRNKVATRQPCSSGGSMGMGCNCLLCRRKPIEALNVWLCPIHSRGTSAYAYSGCGFTCPYSAGPHARSTCTQALRVQRPKENAAGQPRVEVYQADARGGRSGWLWAWATGPDPTLESLGNKWFKWNELELGLRTFFSRRPNYLTPPSSTTP